MAADDHDFGWSVDSPFGQTMSNLDTRIGQALHCFEVELRGSMEFDLKNDAMRLMLIKFAWWIGRAQGKTIDEFIANVAEEVPFLEALEAKREPVQ